MVPPSIVIKDGMGGGEIDVMVVSDGVLTLPGAMLGHNVDPAVRVAWLNDMFLPPDMLEWALNAVVVRSGGRTILIDAGIGMDPGLNLPKAGQLIHRLEAAGIDLASVTDVVLTHLHMDHCGGLLVDGVREQLRPDLRVHLEAAEAKFWESPDFSHVSMPTGFPDALRRTAKRILKEYSSQLRSFEKEYEVAPGVLVQRTGGHTPGHSVVRLVSGGDRLTFVGDAVFQVGFEHPDWYNGYPGSQGDDQLRQPALAAHTVHDLDLVRAAGDSPNKPIAPSLRLLVVAEIHESQQRESGISQPAIAIIPVPHAAEAFGKRRCSGGDDAPGRGVGQRLQRDERAFDRFRPRPDIGTAIAPPVRVSASKPSIAGGGS
jgi:glyoxylase-like metal-dependent hydrolase (beta-lactamase superfamily II)